MSGENQCETDIGNERKKCTFDVQELITFNDGNFEKTKQRKAFENFIFSDPELEYKTPPAYLNHKEKYQEAIRLSCLIMKKIEQWQDISERTSTMEIYQQLIGGNIGAGVFKEGFPFGLHYSMFLPTIMSQGTIEQQSYWFGRGYNNEIFCTYAQTELGHGSFIRGLETTAIYDPKTEEFTLNSPTLTSYKWWPGGLGHSSSHALVFAQLYTKNVCHGIHPFIVQLRDEETWNPLPGVRIGEIGCKMGLNTANNGYLAFNNVRIPRDCLLMKNNQVLKDGTYVKLRNKKLTYGTMIFIRVGLVKQGSAFSLAKAVTIAVRYSAVRRQGDTKQGELEPQILDYPTQQYKLFPAIATVYAFRFASEWLTDIYQNVSAELEHDNLDKLPELHAMACCLKACSTYEANRMIETCRFACGGYGYMTSSNLPNIYNSSCATVTYEGEYTVLLLQTARYLLKVWNQSSTQNVAETCNYLYDHEPTDVHRSWKQTTSCMVKAFQQVAIRKIKNCSDRVNDLVRTGMSYEDARNRISILLTQAAEAHCRSFVAKAYEEKLSLITVSESLRYVFEQLRDLYLIYTILNNLGDFLMYSNLNASDVVDLQSWFESLLAALRPNAVGLVDGFDIHDRVLGSTIGAYDGNVYERLFKEANKSPLNAQQQSGTGKMNRIFKTIIRSTGNIYRCQNCFHAFGKNPGKNIIESAFSFGEEHLSPMVQSTIIPFIRPRVKIEIVDKPIFNGILDKIDRPPIMDAPSSVPSIKENSHTTVIEKLARTWPRINNIKRIRRRKMKKHQRRKLRKRMKFVFLKIQRKRALAKEIDFRNEIMAKLKEAEKFNAEAYVAEKFEILRQKLLPIRHRGVILPQWVIKDIHEKKKLKKERLEAMCERRKKLIEERGSLKVED